MYLLDTNICIYAMKGQYPQLLDKLIALHPDQVKVSVITVLELEYGAAKSRWGARSRAAMKMFLAAFEILPFTEADAISCGSIRAKLGAKGTPISAYDSMIAAQSLSRGLKVVTHNTKEFKRVEALEVEDWVE